MDNQQQTVCSAIILVCLALGLYFIIPKANSAITIYNDVNAKTQTVESLKKQINDLKLKKVAYEKAEKVQTKPVFKSDLDINDDMSSFGVMFEDVIQSAKYNGLKLKSISYNNAPSDDIVYSQMASEYNVCAISMELIGNYTQFRSYFQDIFNYPYLLNLDKISIKPYERNKAILVADVTVVLYSHKTEKQKQIARELEQQANKGDKAVKNTGFSAMISGR